MGTPRYMLIYNHLRLSETLYMKQWKTIDGKPATYSNDRVYSLEYKKSKGIRH